MGKCIALALAEAGANVAIGSLLRRVGDEASEREFDEKLTVNLSENELEGAKDLIAAKGVRALAMPLDVCSDESVAESHGTITAELGAIDILVNAAGTFMYHSYVANHPDYNWYHTINVNLHGPYRTTKHCLGGMIERKWGRVINLASTAANVGASDHAAYCASKAGLLGLTRCVALEGAAHGVTCNAINPGFVATPQNLIRLEQKIRDEGLSTSVEEYRQQLSGSYPQKRLIQPEEVAAVALFLCRDEALGVAGEDITVAGGSVW